MKTIPYISFITLTILLAACTPHSVREAESVVTQADSLWQVGLLPSTLFGQQLSEQLPNTVVIAPNEKVAVTKDAKELGAYKTKELVKPDGTKAQTIDKVGAWVMFREGKMIGSFNGATPPNVTNPKQFQLDN